MTVEASRDSGAKCWDDQARGLVQSLRVGSAEGFHLRNHDSCPPTSVQLDKKQADKLLRDRVHALSKLQERLYANSTWSLLVVLQGMDASGKDSAIKHVMSGVNPQGVSVTSFKAPEGSELAHGFLWRVSRALPSRGMIGVFNRSHYEDVLIARVHPEVLRSQRLPPEVTGRETFWDDRLEDIVAFERHLARQGTAVVKIFLNLSRQEQTRRFLARLDEPDKLWKFTQADIAERERWDDYMGVYERAIGATATDDAPWYVVPADRKWFARLMVAEVMIERLSRLRLEVPPSPLGDPDERHRARRLLEG